MQKYFNNVVDQLGDALFKASVIVSSASGAITIYSDNGVTPIAGNSLQTDANGFFAFYAANGRYNISVSGSGITSYAINDVLLYDPAATSGTTSGRPVTPSIGQPYFDTTLQLPIWCKSIGPSVWINSAGGTV